MMDFNTFSSIKHTRAHRVFVLFTQLPHNVASPYVKSLRRQEIDETKGRYAWRDYPGEGNLGWNLPSFIKASTYRVLIPFKSSPIVIMFWIIMIWKD